jgi:hypothetical protein
MGLCWHACREWSSEVLEMGGHQGPSGPATRWVVPKLARSVPDARDIGDALVRRGVRLSLGGSIYDPTDPHVQDALQHARRVRGRPPADAHPRGHGRRPGEEQAERQVTPADGTPAGPPRQRARHRRTHHRRPRRTVHRQPGHGLPSPGTREQVDCDRSGRMTAAVHHEVTRRSVCPWCQPGAPPPPHPPTLRPVCL